MRDETYSLVLEHGGKVPDDVDDSENQPVLRAHSQVRALRVARERLICGSLCKQSMHLAEATDLLARRIYGEYEQEDDREKDCGMCAVRSAHALAPVNR